MTWRQHAWDVAVGVVMALALGLAVLLASCATASRPLATAGDSLVTLGRTYVGVSQAMVTLCHAGTIDVRTCGDWAVFQKDFRAGFAIGVAGWEATAAGIDGGVVDLSALAGQLDGFVAVVQSSLADAGVP